METFIPFFKKETKSHIVRVSENWITPDNYMVTDIVSLSGGNNIFVAIGDFSATLGDSITPSINFTTGFKVSKAKVTVSGSGKGAMICGYIDEDLPFFSQDEVSQKIELIKKEIAEIKLNIAEKIEETAKKEITEFQIDLLVQKLVDKIKDEINTHVDQEIALLQTHLDGKFK